MSATLEKGGTSQEEANKLIQEIKLLIKNKGLEIDVVEKPGYKIEEPQLASGCTSCTVCPCMICW
jgi:biotin operon repressor